MKTAMIWIASMALMLVSFGYTAIALGEDVAYQGAVDTMLTATPAEQAGSEAVFQATTEPAPDADRWHFLFAPYLWAVKTHGDLTAGPIETSFTLPFSTALDQLKGGFFGHFEAGKNHLGFATDIFYASIAKGGAFSVPLPNGATTDGDLSLKMTYWEVWPYYRMGDDKNTFDIFGGIRYNSYDTGIDFKQVNRTADRKITWVDPMFGARWIGKVHPKVLVAARGDIAGFGAGSKFTFNLQGNVLWQFHRTVGLDLGYRWMDIDYEKSKLEDPEFFKVNISQYGPVMGIVFVF